MRARHRLTPPIWLLALLLAFFPASPARAVDPTLTTIIGYIADAMGEPAIKDAVPLIECVANKGAAACFDIQGMAEAEGKKAAKAYLPDDPKIKAAVDIIKAAYAGDYLKVLEIGGVKLLPPLGCGLVFQIPDPVKGLVCNKQVFNMVSSLSGPVFKQVITTVKNPSPGNLWALYTVMDAKLACSVMKATVGDVPGLDEVCGPLGEVIEFAKDVGEQAAKAGKAAGEFLLDTGEALVKGVGGALEGACEGIGICDDDSSKKLMSGNQYYKYRLFPLIHDRVLARLAKGQQNLGHDDASLQACLTYFHYGLYANNPMFKQLAPLIKQGCADLGARLHKDANALGQAFAAAPPAYFESSVRPLIPAMAVEAYGQNKTTGYRNFVTTVCVTNMRKQFPIPDPTTPGTTAWDHVCNKVGALFLQAYATETKKLESELAKLALFGGCKVPNGWPISKGLKLECDNYGGYQSCLQMLAPGLETKHCTVNGPQADAKLAQFLVDKLGKKRCHASGYDVRCARPWKEDQCKALRTLLGSGAAAGSKVACKGDAAGLAAFVMLQGQASALVNTLNGGSGVIGTKAGLGDVKAKASAGSGSCKSTWDPLAIRCLGGEIAAHPEITLPACAPDPNQDGADAPCNASPLSAKTALEADAKFGVAPGPFALPQGTRAAGERGSGPRRAVPDPDRREGEPRVAERGQAALAAGPARSVNGPAAPLADLVLTSPLYIAGRPAMPGGSLTLPAQMLTPRRGGCEATVEARVQNTGTAASGPSEGIWQAGGTRSASSVFGGLAPGAGETQRTALVLSPGMNVLEFVIDASGRVGESSEGNNRYRFTVTVTGECGAAPATRFPQPGMLAPPATPAPPLPGRAPVPLVPAPPPGAVPAAPMPAPPPALLGPPPAPETSRDTAAPSLRRTPSQR